MSNRHKAAQSRTEGTHVQVITAVDSNDQVIGTWQVGKQALWSRSDDDLFASCIDNGLKRQTDYLKVRLYADEHGRGTVFFRRAYVPKQ